MGGVMDQSTRPFFSMDDLAGMNRRENDILLGKLIAQLEGQGETLARLEADVKEIRQAQEKVRDQMRGVAILGAALGFIAAWLAKHMGGVDISDVRGG